MDLTEDLVSTVAKMYWYDIVTYQGEEINWRPLEENNQIDAVKQYTGVDMLSIQTDEEARQVAGDAGVHIEGKQAGRSIEYSVRGKS